MHSTASGTSHVLRTRPLAGALMRRPVVSLTTPEHAGKRDNCWMGALPHCLPPPPQG